MRKWLGCVCVLVLVWVCPSAAWAGEAAAEDSRDGNGVVAMLTRVEKATVNRDAAGVLKNFSDQGVMLVNPDVTHPDGALFVTKKDLRKKLAESLQSRSIEARFVDCKAAVLPWPADVAYMVVMRAIRGPGLKGMVDRQLMKAHYEGGRWRICASFPLFVDLRVVVETVQPGSPAADAGVKAGDIIVRYAGRPVLHADELVALGKQIAQDPKYADKPVPVAVRRGKDRLGVKLPAGDPGVELATRAEGEADTLTLTGKPGAEHPAAKVVADNYAAMRTGDAKALVATYCPGGFAYFYPAQDEAGKTTIAHPGNAKALAPAFIQAVGRNIKLNTLKAGRIDLIVRGNAALAGCRVTGELQDGQPLDVYDTWLLVKYRGKWGTVGLLPPAAKVRLGLER